jgi:hypothetical protein
MAIAVDVADLGKAAGDPALGTIAFTTTSPVASGGFIVLSVGWFDGTATLSSVAGGGLTWTIDFQGKAGVTSDRVALVSAQAPAGLVSGTTITATFSAATPVAREIGGTSFTGVATSSPVDVALGAAVAVSPSAAGWTSGSLSVAAGSVMVATCYNESGNFTNTVTAPSLQAVLMPNAASPTSQVTCYRIESSAGSVSVAGTWSTAATSGTGAVAYKAAAGGAVADPPRIDLGSPAFLNGPDAPPGFFEALALPVVFDVPVTDLTLDASGGTAAASGSNAALSFSYTPGSGAATAGGSNVVFSDGLTAASGAATAGGGSVTLAATWAVTSGGATAGGGSDTLAVTWSAAAGGATAGGGSDTLTFVYGVSGGNATAGGGSVTETTDTNVSVTGGLATAGGGAVTVAFTYSAAGGAATAGGGTDTGAFTFSAASGAATAGGGSDALTFVFGVAGGGATAGGGSVTESATTGADVSASGGAATAAGGAVSFAVTLTAGAGGAQASGGTVSVSVDVTPPVVVEPPSVGPTGGADFDFGDESAIYGTSARVVSTRGRGHGWGSVARVRVSSAPRPLRIRLPRPRPVVVESARVESVRGAGAGYGASSSSSSTARAVSARGAADGWGAAGRVLTMDGDPEADDLLAMTLLGLL